MSACLFPAAIPGPPQTIAPLRLFRVLRFLGNTIGVGEELFKQYGEFIALSRSGGTNICYNPEKCRGTVLTCAPQALQQVLRQGDVFYRLPNLLYNFRDISPRHDVLNHFTTGLFILNGPSHSAARQYLSPAFRKSAIAMWRDDVVAVTERELNRWPIDKTCDFWPLAYSWSGKVTCQTLLGVAMTDEEITFLHEVFRQCSSPITLLSTLLPYNIPGLPFRKLLQNLEMSSELSRGLIERSQANWDEDSVEKDIRQTFIYLLLKAQAGEGSISLDEGDVLGHFNTLWIAGTETSTGALMWTLFLLSQHPHVAADLLDELTFVLQGEPPTVAQLEELPLLDRVVKESFRLLPPIPWNQRITSKETELCGYSLPPGTEVFMSLYHVHQSPDLFENPKDFRPERWETVNPKSWQYAPFSNGSNRNCIGQRLALLNLKIAIAMITQRFRLQHVPARSINPSGIFSLMSPQGVPVKICPQDREFHRGVGEVQGSVREMVHLPAN